MIIGLTGTQASRWLPQFAALLTRGCEAAAAPQAQAAALQGWTALIRALRVSAQPSTLLTLARRAAGAALGLLRGSGLDCECTRPLAVQLLKEAIEAAGLQTSRVLPPLSDGLVEGIKRAGGGHLHLGTKKTALQNPTQPLGRTTRRASSQRPVEKTGAIVATGEDGDGDANNHGQSPTLVTVTEVLDWLQRDDEIPPAVSGAALCTLRHCLDKDRLWVSDQLRRLSGGEGSEKKQCSSALGSTSHTADVLPKLFAALLRHCEPQAFHALPSDAQGALFDCFALLGAVEPSRLGLPLKAPPKRLPTHRELVLHVVNQHLARVLRTATSLRALDAASFAVQEIFRDCQALMSDDDGGEDQEEPRASKRPRRGFGETTHANSRQHRSVFYALPEDVQEVMQPYLDSKFSLRYGVQRAPGVVFVSSLSPSGSCPSGGGPNAASPSQATLPHPRWLALWMSSMAEHHTQTSPLRPLFLAVLPLLRYDLSLGLALLPYIVVSVIEDDEEKGRDAIVLVCLGPCCALRNANEIHVLEGLPTDSFNRRSRRSWLEDMGAQRERLACRRCLGSWILSNVGLRMPVWRRVGHDNSSGRVEHPRLPYLPPLQQSMPLARCAVFWKQFQGTCWPARRSNRVPGRGLCCIWSCTFGA